ncbi:hypothetical protein HZY91_00645 [Facklamia sp. DSM 111018]|uniref:Uncharacterized protein n=1 Tax=Facklamia lactis TaxID=2749967 RepID=A0ABS0LN55_9LACT|nr:hypothetical protein [Facklamia lactis]MBG9979923.1 hypothetical protein [Facklamia lactis]MBG9985397.1 hypothetical protein [Facklamia lactis]
MNKSKIPTLFDIESQALGAGRQVSYEDDLLLKILGISPENDENGEDPSEELTGEKLFISSAVPLNESDKIRIAKQFMRITGLSIKSLITIVDPTLVIGVRLISERFYYELSGQEILRNLRDQIEVPEIEEVSK